MKNIKKGLRYNMKVKLIDNNIQLAKEWHPTKNLPLKVESVYAYDNKKVWWLCTKGHEFQGVIRQRNNSNSSCPYCTHQKVLKGETDLETVNPFLAKEWHPTKNGNLHPFDIFPNHHKKVWWLCPFGHEYEATPLHRNSGKTGCPICSKERQTSFPEQVIFYYFSKHFPNVKNRYIIDGVEFDIFLLDYNIGIEYDGNVFHNNIKKINKDNAKNRFSKQKGITLYRIIEDDNYISQLEDIDFENIFIARYANNFDELTLVILKIFSLLPSVEKIIPNIDISRDYINILQNYVSYEKTESLECKFPLIAKEWHPLKNEDLKPSMFRKSSNHYVWWLCERGHEYKAKINNRVNGLGCPYCSGAKPLKGFNTLADMFPQILLEWDYEKNIKTPYDYLPSTKDKVFLICSKCGYKHESIINKVNRSFKSGNNGCPVCSKKVLITNVNDFKTKYPMLAQEWDYEKNKTKPEDYLASSIENVWWVCKSCNNSWLDTINHRVYRNSSCLFCSSRKKKLLVGFSDLATTNPEILNEWDYEKNIIKPQDVTNRSRKKVYWICNKGHSYYQEINSHIKGFGCKYCSGHDVLKGFNDVSTTNPEILEIWDFETNLENNIYIDRLSKGSAKIVHLKCKKCNKMWKKRLYDLKSFKCPRCNK